MSGYALRQAEREVAVTYGETVSVYIRGKTVRQFGNNAVVGTSFETLAQLQNGLGNETYVSSNIIDSITSSDASDGQTLTLEGHTIDEVGNLTFVSQQVTLNGQSEVLLSTPLARANDISLSPSGSFDVTPSPPAGTVYIYDNTDGITSGVPNTVAATKLILAAGSARSEKGATSIPFNEYLFITSVSGRIGPAGGGADRVEVILEVRDVANGGAFVRAGAPMVIQVGGGAGDPQPIFPYIVVPKNHDVRLRARANQSTAQVFGEFDGFLACVVN